MKTEQGDAYYLKFFLHKEECDTYFIFDVVDDQNKRLAANDPRMISAMTIIKFALVRLGVDINADPTIRSTRMRRDLVCLRVSEFVKSGITKEEILHEVKGEYARVLHEVKAHMSSPLLPTPLTDRQVNLSLDPYVSAEYIVFDTDSLLIGFGDALNPPETSRMLAKVLADRPQRDRVRAEQAARRFAK